MLNSIERIRGVGVFDRYQRLAETKEFASTNVIYGWNYSGKTTLSRLFAHLEHGVAVDGLAGGSFTINSDQGQITEANAANCGHIVRVFNSDFVAENLNFSHAHGRPILLLGSESEAAQKEIARIADQRARIIQATARQEAKAERERLELAAAKKSAAAATKSTLSLVDIYTATQLDIDLKTIKLTENDYKLSPEALAVATKIARTPDDESLPRLEPITATSRVEEHWRAGKELLAQIPQVANVIHHLIESPNVSNWVEEGLHLHEGKTCCEFCGNTLSNDRLEALRAHFSRAQAEFKEQVSNLLSNIQSARVLQDLPSARMVYPQFRDDFETAARKLDAAAKTHDEIVGQLERELKSKEQNLFAPIFLAEKPSASGIEAWHGAAKELNEIIMRHNAVAGRFREEKLGAIESAKFHYAQLFHDAHQIGSHAKRQNRYQARVEIFRRIGEDLDARRKALEAQINKAQRGREEINRRIETLLGSDSVQIEVTKLDGEDRFKLVRRDGTIAKNLSEGEKTAIGFAFFLAKLQELQDFSSAIVFIDDPISSLDSNHIFQVAAIIRELFFTKENSAWKTTCKQLFLSTHNFEFLGLLRDLPMKKKAANFLVHRTAPGASIISNMPASILAHDSEYHFLFSVIDRFDRAADKTNLETLMHLPNAVRRFVELYTYAKYPAGTVDQRAEMLFGVEKGRRILKVLHHFSHGNSVERLARNSDLISDIAAAVGDLMALIRENDEKHLEALMSA